MVDTDLLVHELKKYGHIVGDVNPVPENAGEFEFVIDGEQFSLVEARALLEADQISHAPNPSSV